MAALCDETACPRSNAGTVLQKSPTFEAQRPKSKGSHRRSDEPCDNWPHALLPHAVVSLSDAASSRSKIQHSTCDPSPRCWIRWTVSARSRSPSRNVYKRNHDSILNTVHHQCHRLLRVDSEGCTSAATKWCFSPVQVIVATGWPILVTSQQC